MQRCWLALVVLGPILGLGACIGSVADGGPRARGGSPAPQPEGGPVPPGQQPVPSQQPPGTAGPAPAPGLGRLRLLTRAQFENSLRDLLGDVVIGPTEPDALSEGFASIGASYSTISPHGLEQIGAAVLGALTPLFANPGQRAGLLGCTPAGLADQSCVRRFVTNFGLRAWRRPLTAVEIERYTRLALDAGASLADVNAGLLHATSALLTSANFLYRVELGQPGAGGGRYRYAGWEMASRLSYLLWNTTPDSGLLAAAEGGKLLTAEGIRGEVARLLASPRARAGFASGFGRELVDFDALAQVPKNDPRMTPTLREAMAGELRQLFESRLEPKADLLDLIDRNTAFVTGELAAIYGITGVTGTTPVAAPLPDNIPRAGLLGTAAFLTLQSKQDATSPTARGKFVREALLCGEVPDPPDNVDTTLLDPPPGQTPTLRQHMEMHRSNPACAACHALMDPLGYAFESFDWIGALRDKDNGKPVDTTGQLEGTRFANAREFVTALRKLPQTQDCLLRNLFRYTHGHKETAADAAELAFWSTSFEANGHQLMPFLAEMTAGEGFRSVSQAP
jgi:hypothetical protein